MTRSRLLNLGLSTFLAVICLTSAAYAIAQVPIRGSFVSNSAEPGWVGTGPVFLTAGSLDKPGDGWLRLTEAASASQSTVIHNNTFSVSNGLRLSFQYAIWGGGEPGGDGMSVFLFDASADMRGSAGGGGLGYCKGAGGWLGIGFDAYGNFAASTAECDGGPGFSPQALVIRGPVGTKNVFIGGASLKGMLSQNAAKQRPDVYEVQIELTPKAQGAGYFVNITMKEPKTGNPIKVISNLDFPFAAPPLLRLGIAASTGGAKNVHEIRQITLSAINSAGLNVAQRFEPATVAVNSKSTLTYVFKPEDGKPGTLTQGSSLPIEPGLNITKPVVLGGTCPGTVSVNPAGNGLELAKGFVIRPMGCTVSVQVSPVKAGTYQNKLGPGQLQIESGANASPSSATLTVTP